MKKILFTLLLSFPLFFNSCQKDLPSPNPNPINLLVDEEPQALVDSLGTLVFDNPMTSDVSSMSEAIIMDYPTFMDYDPFTMVTVRTGIVDSCVRGLEITKEQKEKLSKAWLSKIECQKENKLKISRIHREIETWAKTQKQNYYQNWYLVEKVKIEYDFKMGVINQTQYKEKLASLEKTWNNKMSYLNGQVKEKIKNSVDRASACGKIKDCEKIWLNSVLEILGKEKYKKWIECYKYNYKKKK